MNNNSHLLQKVTFEIGLASQDGAFEIQTRISNAFQSRILKELEKLFDRKVGGNRVITIEKMEINLGSLSAARLEEDLASTIEKEVEGFLAAVEHELANRNSTSDSFTLSVSHSNSTKSQNISVQWPLPTNPHFEAHITIAEDSISVFEKITFLLEYGIHPVAWTAGASKKLSELIAVVFADHSERLVQFIRSNRYNTRIIQRLVFNLTVEQLQYLAALLGCPFSYDLPKLTRELELLLKARAVTAGDFVANSVCAFSEIQQYLWFSIISRYVTREENQPALPVRSEKMDEKTVLLVRLLLSEPHILRKIFIKHASGITLREKKELASIAAAIEQIAPTVVAVRKATKHVPLSAADAEKSAKRDKGEPGVKPGEPTMQEVSYEAPETTIFKDDKSDGGDDPIQVDTGIYISNAGLIILAPYFVHLFRNLRLIEGKAFINKEASVKAVHLLQYACGFENKEDFEGHSEHDLFFNKILCGLDSTEPVPESYQLSNDEKDEVQNLLKAVLNNWTIMQRSSIHALQTTFLQKQGRLSKIGSDWEMLVERDSAVEILIDKLPWGISMIKLPWNEYTIHTQW